LVTSRSLKSLFDWLSVLRQRSEPLDPADAWAEQAMDRAVEWLLRAQARSGDGGVPAFYDWPRNRWAPSYPETTGYLIPTLLTYGKWAARPDVCRAALVMADYLLSVQTPEGAIPGWGAGSPVFIFDTAQVLQGWLAAWQQVRKADYVAAVRRAADWLVDQQDPGGFWTRYQFGSHVKTWDVRVGWPLIQAGRAVGETDYLEAGRRCLDWTLTQQQTDGWFEQCSLEPGEPPVLHTIAYAIEGLLEGGLLLGETRHVEAAQRAADALLARQRPDGGLSAYWLPGWRPASGSSCLTGDAQMALCWLRLHQITGKPNYRDAARCILRFVAGAQHPGDSWPPVRGAIAGSQPLWGRYLRWRYPNWAGKFFLDALLLERQMARMA
jgi:hypothetical protein